MTNEDAHPVLGRPRAFCAEAALRAAMRVFWSKGYEGASLSELTKAMGINRPSLYAAFGSKEALFRSALDLYGREKTGFMADALSAPTARGVAERALIGALEAQTSPGEPTGCLLVIHAVACGVDGEAARAAVLACHAAGDAALLARFEQAKQEGDIPETVEPKDLVRLLAALLQGLAVQAGAGIPRTDLERLVRTALQVWPTR